MDVERRDVCEVAAPTLLRVLARPVLLARDRPDEESRPVAPIPEGTIVEVSLSTLSTNTRARAKKNVTLENDQERAGLLGQGKERKGRKR